MVSHSKIFPLILTNVGNNKPPPTVMVVRFRQIPKPEKVESAKLSPSPLLKEQSEAESQSDTSGEKQRLLNTTTSKHESQDTAKDTESVEDFRTTIRGHSLYGGYHAVAGDGFSDDGYQTAAVTSDFLDDEYQTAIRNGFSHTDLKTVSSTYRSEAIKTKSPSSKGNKHISQTGGSKARMESRPSRSSEQVSDADESQSRMMSGFTKSSEPSLHSRQSSKKLSKVKLRPQAETSDESRSESAPVLEGPDLTSTEIEKSAEHQKEGNVIVVGDKWKILFNSAKHVIFRRNDLIRSVCK
ncbi:unnamed protein product [Gongylonema pulchrum]|uniref:Uncharacterized protein n=1 Tax=Gongylonema pulchrum TaxID=637853 RepID=A0A183D781_9BILA|nr:unnamed protein product [Gongylonema pulchrum]